MTNRKAIRKKNAASNLNKQFMMGAVKVIAKKIVDEKVKNNGRAPWGFASKLLEEGRKTFPSMSRRTLNNYIKRLEKEIVLQTETAMVIMKRLIMLVPMGQASNQMRVRVPKQVIQATRILIVT